MERAERTAARPNRRKRSASELRPLRLASAPVAHYSPADFFDPLLDLAGELMDPRFIDDLARKLSAAVPQSVANIRRDLEDNFKAVLQSALARMDLVTRQEFDVQAGVLRRTREKLEALETKLAALEAGANQKANSPPSSGGMS
jgi:BMFP domain-containing protein YqiC